MAGRRRQSRFPDGVREILQPSSAALVKLDDYTSLVTSACVLSRPNVRSTRLAGPDCVRCGMMRSLPAWLPSSTATPRLWCLLRPHLTGHASHLVRICGRRMHSPTGRLTRSTVSLGEVSPAPFTKGGIRITSRDAISSESIRHLVSL